MIEIDRGQIFFEKKQRVNFVNQFRFRVESGFLPKRTQNVQTEGVKRHYLNLRGFRRMLRRDPRPHFFRRFVGKSESQNSFRRRAFSEQI